MQPLYKLMEINSERLVIDRNVYQRKQHNDKITQIVASWDERIANEPKVSLRDGVYHVFDGQHTILAREAIEQTGEIKQRINELRSRRIKLMNDNEEERCIELLRETMQELEELPQAILLFDFNIFDKLVNKVAVMPDSLVFELRCGIKLREKIIWN